MAAHPTFFLIGKLGCSADAHIVELSGNLSSDSPYIFYREQRQGLVSSFIRIDEAAALVPLVFLCEFGSDFRQSLCFSDADGDRDSYGSEHIGRNSGSILMQQGVIILKSIVFFQIFLEEVLCHGIIRFEEALCHGIIHIEEAFVDGVLVDAGRVVRQHRHHPVGERSIECIVAGEDGHVFSLQFFLYLIEGVSHLISQSLGFF